MLSPRSDRILARPDDAILHASQVGIVVAPRDGKIVESQQQFGRRGVAVAVGPGKRTKKGVLLPMSVKPGDVIFWGEFMDQTIDVAGIQHYVISEMDVTAIETVAK